MPITRIQSTTGITSRGPTVEDADFTATAQVRDTIVTPGSESASVVDDRNITTQTGATVDRSADIDAKEMVVGTFSPFLRFESLDPSIATVDSIGNVTRVSDGTARIKVRTALAKKLVNVEVSRITTTTVVFNGYIAGSLAKNCSDAIDTRIAGKTAATAKPIYSSRNQDTGACTRNPDCWVSNLDLTCVSPWNSAGEFSYAGTAISPRHIIWAKHFPSIPIPVGTTFHFFADDGTLVTRTLSAVQNVAGSGTAYDLTIGLLDSDLPDSIRYAKVLPSDVANYLPSLSSLYSVPAVIIDREEKALISELYTLDGNICYFHQPTDEARLEYYEQLISGDSGNPAFLVINGSPVLVTTLTFAGGGGGPRIHALHTEINAAMTTLGGGYQLTEVSLASFTNFN